MQSKGLKKEAKAKRDSSAAEDENGGYFRIRSDRFSWKGKKAGGWAVVCDMMPDDDPAHDPDKDADIIEDLELVEYVINSSLHEMISAARQSQGIFIVEK